MHTLLYVITDTVQPRTTVLRAPPRHHIRTRASLAHRHLCKAALTACDMQPNGSGGAKERSPTPSSEGASARTRRRSPPKDSPEKNSPDSPPPAPNGVSVNETVPNGAVANGATPSSSGATSSGETGSGSSCSREESEGGSAGSGRATKRRRVERKTPDGDENATGEEHPAQAPPSSPALRGARTRRLAEAERGTEVKKDKVIPEELTAPHAPVHLSTADRSPPLVLLEPAVGDERKLPRARGHKGFRSVRASHGVSSGTWYFEVEVRALPGEAAVRLGWSTRKMDLETPVGYSVYSFGLRDRTGEFVHRGRRKDYGVDFNIGDVVGCLIVLPASLPAAHRAMIKTAEEAWLLYKYVEGGKVPDDAACSFEKAHCKWSKNGVDMGIPEFFTRKKNGDAKSDPVMAATYYPTVSLFREAEVAVNFGPDFRHQMPEGAKPYIEVAPPPVAAEKTAEAAGKDEVSDAAEGKTIKF